MRSIVAGIWWWRHVIGGPEEPLVPLGGQETLVSWADC